MALSGCSAQSAPDPVEDETAAATEEDTLTEASGETTSPTQSLPSGFPQEVPLLPYEFTSVKSREEANEYRIQMLGTDAAADAQQARSQFEEAGFTETLWNELEGGNKVSGLFTSDNTVVTFTLRQSEAGVEIDDNIGQH